MREELQKHLDDNCHKLVKQLDIDSGILNRLLARDIITSDHLADIKAERTSRRKIEVLLEKLKTRDDKYYSIFRCEVAREQPQCAEQCLPPSDDNLPFPKEEQTPTTSKTLDAI